MPNAQDVIHHQLRSQRATPADVRRERVRTRRRDVACNRQSAIGAA